MLRLLRSLWQAVVIPCNPEVLIQIAVDFKYHQ
jgi:hypothetical protein